MDKILIPVDEYIKLKDDALLLEALQDRGVHTWEYYDSAVYSYELSKEVDDIDLLVQDIADLPPINIAGDCGNHGVELDKEEIKSMLIKFIEKLKED